MGTDDKPNWLYRSFNETRTAAVILRIIYALVILLALGIGLATVYGADDPVICKVGMILGLIGFSIIACQVILNSRLRTLDKAFGLDKVVNFHRKMGIVAGGLLIIHPVLIALSQKSLKLFSLSNPWQVNLGKGAWLVLVAGVLLALFYYRFKMDYNVWRLFHKAMIIVVALAFVHSLFIGDAFEVSVIKVWWFILAVCAFAAFCWQNFIINPFGRKKFTVKSITKETHDTFTFAFEPADGKLFTYKPGQFMFLNLRAKLLPSEEHPFTISSSPTQQGHITATIKKSGDFTNMIDQTQVSDTALVQAPFGRFSWVFDNPQSILFIAGGVGITPIHSMIMALRDTGDKRNVILLYGNKTEADFIFRNEFEKLPKNFKVINILSRPANNWKGLTGHIDSEFIKQHAGNILNQADIFLCGPQAMMQNILNAPESLEIDKKRIHYERFTI